MGVDINRTIGLETCTIENWIKAWKVLEILSFAGLWIIFYYCCESINKRFKGTVVDW